MFARTRRLGICRRLFECAGGACRLTGLAAFGGVIAFAGTITFAGIPAFAIVAAKADLPAGTIGGNLGVSF